MENALAGHVNSYRHYPLEERLRGIAEAGYRHVELSALPGRMEQVSLADDGRELRARLDHYGLAAASLSAHSELSTDDGLRHALEAIRWAAGFGIAIVNTAIGGEGAGPEGGAAFFANAERLADAAGSAGVVVALEIHGELMGSGAKARDVIERIGREEIRVNYDTANCVYYGGVRAVDDLPEIVEHVAHVHLKDKRGGAGVWDFPPIGEGDVDFAALLAILERAGYAGPCSVEIEFQGDPWPALPEVNRAMRDSRERLVALGLGRG
jgi:L-ribulose-5-phosphate 3-epimerase